LRICLIFIFFPPCIANAGDTASVVQNGAAPQMNSFRLIMLTHLCSLLLFFVTYYKFLNTHYHRIKCQCGIALKTPLVAVSSAGVTFMAAAAGLSCFVVVVALEVGAGRESSGEIGLDRRFRVAGNAADYFDAGFGKSRHRATADPSADEKVDLVLAEQPGERAMPDTA
jgi:hypothetical protein